LSSLHHSEVGELLFSLGDAITKESDDEFIRGENDTFHLEKPTSTWQMSAVGESLATVVPDEENPHAPEKDIDHSKVLKRLVAHEDAWPDPKETPHFNHAAFYSSLTEYRQKEAEAEGWGDVFMYGEVVTSTNTLLEKYSSLHPH
jgi:biotin--protein ligase